MAVAGLPVPAGLEQDLCQPYKHQAPRVFNWTHTDVEQGFGFAEALTSLYAYNNQLNFTAFSLP